MKRGGRHSRWRISLLACLCLWALAVLPDWAHSAPDHSASFDVASKRAEAARDKGDIAAAIRLYHQALQLEPTWQEGWWYYGSLLYDNNQYAASVSALRRLTALNPKLGGAWALLGLSEFETQDYDHALGHLQKGKILGFGDAQSLADVADYHLALLYNRRGDCDRARSLLGTLLLRGATSEDLQVALGLSLLRVSLLPSQLDPSKDALIHDAGNVAAFVARRQFDQADAGFRQLLAAYPAAHFAHYAYGSMLASRGQEDLAKAQFREETALTPDSALAYMEWAFLEMKAVNYHDALPLAQTAIQLSPNSFLAHYLLGNSLLATGSTKAAVSQLEIARRLAPDSSAVRYSLGRAYAKVGDAQNARREQAKFVQLQAERRKKAGSEGDVNLSGADRLDGNLPRD